MCFRLSIPSINTIVRVWRVLIYSWLFIVIENKLKIQNYCILSSYSEFLLVVSIEILCLWLFTFIINGIIVKFNQLSSRFAFVGIWQDVLNLDVGRETTQGSKGIITNSSSFFESYSSGRFKGETYCCIMIDIGAIMHSEKSNQQIAFRAAIVFSSYDRRIITERSSNYF